MGHFSRRSILSASRVAVKVSHPRLVYGEAGGFAYVVEQGGAAEEIVLRRDRRQGVEAVLPHIVAVVAVPLVQAHHVQQFRPEDPCRLRKGPQGFCRKGALEQFAELRPDPFHGDFPQKTPLPAEGCRRVRMDGKAQFRQEPQAPEDPQGILLEPLIRIPYAPEEPRLQIRPAAQRIPQFPGQIHRHGVDGKVPPAEILLQGAGEGHGVRPAVVAVCPVHPKGGGLNRAALRPDGDRAVFQPGGKGAGQGHGLLRQSRRGHVPVPGDAAQKGVPDAAAHAPGLMARRFQLLQHLPDIWGNLHHDFTAFFGCKSLVPVL